MSKQKLAMTAVAGVGLISAVVYSTRKGEHTIDDVEKRRLAQEHHKGGAGNGIATGTDKALVPDKDAQRRQVTTAGNGSSNNPNSGTNGTTQNESNLRSR